MDDLAALTADILTAYDTRESRAPGHGFFARELANGDRLLAALPESPNSHADIELSIVRGGRYGTVPCTAESLRDRAESLRHLIAMADRAIEDV